MKFWQKVKIWHSLQRLQGLQVTEDEIMDQFFDALDLELEIHRQIDKAGKLKIRQVQWMEEMQDRKQKLLDSPKYLSVYRDRLMAWGEMKVGQPSRGHR